MPENANQIWKLSIGMTNGTLLTMLGNYEVLEAFRQEWIQWFKPYHESLNADEETWKGETVLPKIGEVHGHTDTYDRADQSITIDFRNIDYVNLMMYYSR